MDRWPNGCPFLNASSVVRFLWGTTLSTANIGSVLPGVIVAGIHPQHTDPDLDSSEV